MGERIARIELGGWCEFFTRVRFLDRENRVNVGNRTKFLINIVTIMAGPG
jgi:hypothetical protein